jgi:23S rRNA (adenine2503-C2)-methyltransferase
LLFVSFLLLLYAHLAISLHSPFPSQRSELMPAERAFSIKEMVDLLKNYDFSKQRRL